MSASLIGSRKPSRLLQTPKETSVHAYSDGTVTVTYFSTALLNRHIPDLKCIFTIMDAGIIAV